MNKNRERIKRGRLNSLSELPENKLNIFKTIKEEIDVFYQKDVEVEIFGSHYWGNWDEFSDYDVVITERGFNCFEVAKKISENLKIKVDIFYSRNKVNTILIK